MNRDIDLEQCRIFSERDVYAAWDNVGKLSMDFKGLHRLLLAMKKDPTRRG